MYISPADYARAYSGKLLFYKGIPYCYWQDKFGHNYTVFWSRNGQSGCICIASKRKCWECIKESIDRHLANIFCPFCVTPSCIGSGDGRYTCTSCDRTGSLYLWYWYESHGMDEFELDFRHPQWQAQELFGDR